jgi:photosynthesis system II assembly factor YCF48-like protein/putative zinc finger protein
MQNVPKFVLQRLRQTTPGAESHPDADLLTAFAEQSLAGRERLLVVEHLAGCGDCRDVVALALPVSEIASELVSVDVGGLGWRWFSWPVLRWGALAAGILAVASVGVLQYSGRNRESIVASDLRQKDAAVGNRAMGEVATVPSNEKPSEPSVAQESSANIRAARPMTRASSGGGIGGGATASAGSGLVGGSGADTGQEVSPPADSLVAQASASPTPVPTPQNPPPEMRQQVMASGSSQVVEVQSAAGTINTESATVGNQIAQNQIAVNQAELPLQGRNPANLDVVKAKDPVPAQGQANSSSALTIASPNVPAPTLRSGMVPASPRWSITPAGALQRSFDGGNSWESVTPTPNQVFAGAKVAADSITVNERVTADKDVGKNNNEDKKLQKVAAPSSFTPVFRTLATNGLDVWVGGSAGTLYHTADGGSRWSRVTPSEAGAVLAGDITIIEFADPQHGKIVTSTGEVWITSDSGQTWQKKQL